MRVEMTLRATIAYQEAEGDLKQRLSDVLEAFESGEPLPADWVKRSYARPGVFIAKIDDYRLFFEYEHEYEHEHEHEHEHEYDHDHDHDAVTILDIVPRSEAYQ